MADTPDYSSLLSNDPVYQQAYAQWQAQQAAAQAQFSYLAGQANQAYSGPLGTVFRLAQLGKQIGQEHAQRLLGIVNGLTARGLGISGELGYQRGLENTRYGYAQTGLQEQQLDAQRALQSNLYNLGLGYQNQLQGYGSSLLSAANDAYARQLNLYEALNPGGPAGQATTQTYAQPPFNMANDTITPTSSASPFVQNVGAGLASGFSAKPPTVKPPTAAPKPATFKPPSYLAYGHI